MDRLIEILNNLKNNCSTDESITDLENMFKEGYKPTKYIIRRCTHKPSIKVQYNRVTADIGTDKMLEKLDNLDIPFCSSKLAIDEYTLEDIVQALKQPTRDYRDDFAAPILRSDILKIENLKNGMKLQGTVRNVVDFGAFVDIGLKNDGLVHISQMSNDYIKHPLDVVSVGDIVDCYVKDINLEKGKVQLSFLEK